ncbi:hypothetical protein M885DRAFT_53869 [Pelagophyceae sp. CCMP2097]|nr:hypothetical protein M885DRAFT_53869 [Pelagophyceae sp. CCMP2097]
MSASPESAKPIRQTRASANPRVPGRHGEPGMSASPGWCGRSSASADRIPRVGKPARALIHAPMNTCGYMHASPSPRLGPPASAPARRARGRFGTAQTHPKICKKRLSQKRFAKVAKKWVWKALDSTHLSMATKTIRAVSLATFSRLKPRRRCAAAASCQHPRRCASELGAFFSILRKQRSTRNSKTRFSSSPQAGDGGSGAWRSKVYHASRGVTLGPSTQSTRVRSRDGFALQPAGRACRVIAF